MKFLAMIPFLSLTALAAAIAEPEAYADGVAADALLDKRAPNCNQIVPRCAAGTFIGRNACKCPGQKPTCGLWACPRGRRQVCGGQGSGCVFV